MKARLSRLFHSSLSLRRLSSQSSSRDNNNANNNSNSVNKPPPPIAAAPPADQPTQEDNMKLPFGAENDAARLWNGLVNALTWTSSPTSAAAAAAASPSSPGSSATASSTAIRPRASTTPTDIAAAASPSGEQPVVPPPRQFERNLAAQELELHAAHSEPLTPASEVVEARANEDTSTKQETEAYNVLSALVKTYFSDVPLNALQIFAAMSLYKTLQQRQADEEELLERQHGYTHSHGRTAGHGGSAVEMTPVNPLDAAAPFPHLRESNKMHHLGGHHNYSHPDVIDRLHHLDLTTIDPTDDGLIPIDLASSGPGQSSGGHRPAASVSATSSASTSTESSSFASAGSAANPRPFNPAAEVNVPGAHYRSPLSLTEMRDIQHFLHFSTSTYGWHYVGVWLGAMQPLQVLQAMSSADGNLHAVAAQTKINPKEDVLFYQFESKLYKPAHLMAVDHRTRSVVLAIRGSFELKDALTDVVAVYQEFQCSNGEKIVAHSGMLRAAQWVVDDMAGALDLATRRFGYSPVFVGHSLGAGVATIASIMLKDRFPDLKVYAFGPPCSVDKRTASSQWCREHIISVVNGNDLVSRLSIGSISDMKDILVRLESRNRIFSHLVPFSNFESDQFSHDISLPPDGPPKLCLAGRIIHIVKRPGVSAAEAAAASAGASTAATTTAAASSTTSSVSLSSAPAAATGAQHGSRNRKDGMPVTAPAHRVGNASDWNLFTQMNPSPRQTAATGGGGGGAGRAHEQAPAPSQTSGPSSWLPWLASLPWRTVPPRYLVFDRDPDYFDRILIIGDYINDHFPDRYETAVEKVIEEMKRDLSATHRPANAHPHM